MWQTFYIIEDGGTCGGEARHGLKEGVGEIGDIASDEERQGAEETEQSPCQCDDKERVASAHGVGGLSTEVSEGETEHLGDEY